MIKKNCRKWLLLFDGMVKCKHRAAERFDCFFEQAIQNERRAEKAGDDGTAQQP